MRSVAVDTKAKSYEILIEEGVLDNPAEHLEKGMDQETLRHFDRHERVPALRKESVKESF